MSGDGFRQRVLAFFRRLRAEPVTEEQSVAGEELRRRLIALFRRLRAAGFNLGLAELLDAMELLESDAPAHWQNDLRLLCCRDRDEIKTFNTVWAEVWKSLPRAEKPAEPGGKPPQAPVKEHADEIGRAHV